MSEPSAFRKWYGRGISVPVNDIHSDTEIRRAVAAWSWIAALKEAAKRISELRWRYRENHEAHCALLDAQSAIESLLEGESE